MNEKLKCDMFETALCNYYNINPPCHYESTHNILCLNKNNNITEKRKYNVKIDGYKFKNEACYLRADLSKSQRKRYLDNMKREKEMFSKEE